MQRRDLVIGTIVLVVIAGIVLFIQRRRQDLTVPLASPSPTNSITQQEEELEDRFNIEVPEDVEKASLRDTKGLGFEGLATRNFENGVFDMTILVDLPDPAKGSFYQVWLKNGQNRLMGTMSLAKGGYLLDISRREDLTAFDNVIVSLENTNDSQIEEVVLQGSF